MENKARKTWDDKNFWGKAATAASVASLATPIAPVGAAYLSGTWENPVIGAIKKNQSQTLTDLEEAKKLQEEINATAQPNYTVSPELQNYYKTLKDRSEQGFTSEQTSAFENALANSRNVALINAREAGGGSMAKYLNTATAGNDINAQIDFAGKDASLMADNIKALGTGTQMLQNQKNLTTEVDVARRKALEDNIGKAISDLRYQTREDRTALATAKDARNERWLSRGFELAKGAISTGMGMPSVPSVQNTPIGQPPTGQSYDQNFIG